MKDVQLLKWPAAGTPVSAEDTDIEINAINGDFIWLDGHDRKRQDIVKMFLTSLASNPVFPNYGTLMSAAIGQRLFADVEQRIRDSVIQGISYLKSVETSTLASERIQAIQSLTVEKANPQELIIRLSVILEDGFVVIAEVVS